MHIQINLLISGPFYDLLGVKRRFMTAFLGVLPIKLTVFLMTGRGNTWYCT